MSVLVSSPKVGEGMSEQRRLIAGLGRQEGNVIRGGGNATPSLADWFGGEGLTQRGKEDYSDLCERSLK